MKFKTSFNIYARNQPDSNNYVTTYKNFIALFNCYNCQHIKCESDGVIALNPCSCTVYSSLY